MPSTPTSPVTPSRKRRSLRLSSHDSISASPFTSEATNGTSFSRRSSRTSQTSLYSLVTARPPSSRSNRRPSFGDRKHSGRLSIGSVNSLELRDGEDLGNLADELEEAWEEDEVDGQTSGFLDGLREEENEYAVQSPKEVNFSHDLESSRVASRRMTNNSLLPPDPISPRKPTARRSKHTQTESMYDGSDYGPDSDDEDSGISPLLARRLREVEDITRISMNTDTVSEDGGMVQRTTHALKDLGPQSNLEYGVGRLITAYTSMDTHRTHQTREVFAQAHSLLYGRLLEVPEEMIDLITMEVENLIQTLPFLSKQNPLSALQLVASQTSDLAYTLRSLTDVLQESRISTTAATRKLKTVKEMVDDLRMEEDLVETSMMLIQAGDWDRRCRERHAARSCQEVIEGFSHRWGVELDESSWQQKTPIAAS